MVYCFEICKNKVGEFVVYFCYNVEMIFWIEGYVSKVSVKNVIELIWKNGFGVEVVDMIV